MNLNTLMKLGDFTVEDTSRLKDIKRILKELSEHSRKFGLLSLERKIAEYQYIPYILKKGIELVLIGFHLNQLEEILCNYVFINKYNNEQLVEAIMIINALVCIQSGEEEIYVEELLNSLIPLID